MTNIKSFTFNSFYENTYLVWDDESKETMVIDPGCSDPFEEKQIENFVNDNNLIIKYLVNTHCHIDHILGVKFIKEKYNVPYYAPEADVPMLEHVDIQAESVGISVEKVPLPDNFLNEEIKLTLGKTYPLFLFTPGHTPGEYSIYFKEDKFCITGDVLFRESIGRTDLWGGDFKTIMNSIKTKLLTLPGNTIIYPGHGEPSSIDYEIKNNPFLADI